MTPTPELTATDTPSDRHTQSVEALATALHGDRDDGVLGEPHIGPVGTGIVYRCECREQAAAILAALPEGTVLVTVDDVARRLCGCRNPTNLEGHRAEARRLLGVE